MLEAFHFVLFGVCGVVSADFFSSLRLCRFRFFCLVGWLVLYASTLKAVRILIKQLLLFFSVLYFEAVATA